ncbi:MAG: carbohydrate ABC transporter permease, partial [Sphaerochaetaceae bacterium]
YFLNSLLVTIITIFGVLIVASLCAYGLRRYKFKLSAIILLVCMGGLMMNPQVCLIPIYSLLNTLHIRNTYWALILPYIAFRLSLSVLLIRSYFLGIPREMEESARMDGCSDFTIYQRIFMPISKPIMVTCAILTAYYAWNEFLFAVIFIDSEKYKTIPSGLMTFRDALSTNWGVMLAGMVISAIPLIVMFIVLQKQFIRGMTAGSVKG